MKEKIKKNEMLRCSVRLVEATLWLTSIALELPGVALLKLSNLCESAIDQIHVKVYGTSLHKEEESD